MQDNPWRPIGSAPRNGRQIEVRLADGKTMIAEHLWDADELTIGDPLKNEVNWGLVIPSAHAEWRGKKLAPVVEWREILSSTIEHRPWVGSEYCAGISGQKIAIVGHSHHKGPDEVDTEDETNLCVSRVSSGEWGDIAFFNNIRAYFDYDSADAFWQRVLFFNFLPNVVGDHNDRYGYGTAEQLECGNFILMRDAHYI